MYKSLSTSVAMAVLAAVVAMTMPAAAQQRGDGHRNNDRSDRSDRYDRNDRRDNDRRSSHDRDRDRDNVHGWYRGHRGQMYRVNSNGWYRGADRRLHRADANRWYRGHDNGWHRGWRNTQNRWQQPVFVVPNQIYQEQAPVEQQGNSLNFHLNLPSD